MTCGVNKTAPGGTRSAGTIFFLSGTHGPLVDGDRDRKGDDSLRDAKPKLGARNERHEVVPCRGGSLDRFAGISVIPQHGHFNVAGAAARGPAVSTGAVIEVVWALPVVMLVGLVAVVVMVFAGRTVVMAAGGIGVSGVSESHRAAEKQRQEHCK